MKGRGRGTKLAREGRTKEGGEEDGDERKMKGNEGRRGL